MISLFLLAAVPAQGGLLPSTPEMVVSAAVDCWQAVDGAAVQEAELKAKGWAPGTITSPKGKPIDAKITVYGKSGTNAVLILSGQADPRGCMVVSALATPADISAAAQLLHARLKSLDPKVEGKKVSAGEVAFFLLPKAAVMRVTGSKDKPGTMIQVSYTATGKK